ncbi:GNAT family N-acetyltransferase [Salinispira pacifica]|uniref:GNAT family N-acetyltransferase n=1 Tax=Salinispira pacifica TaxID=1307761 RepID=V5WIS9_9SPIO|nr:GNAT family N-acetyltransferase [Salinispira pacifica]AHC15747.1 hypothetical protein L21SP2_2394 [Salinispira pacifica]
MMQKRGLKFVLCSSLDQVDPDEWNSFLSSQSPPFLRYHWMRAYEISGSMTPETGWQPIHLLGIEDDGSSPNPDTPGVPAVDGGVPTVDGDPPEGRPSKQTAEQPSTQTEKQGRYRGLRFALPLYIKSHSWGEFVFDFAWADVARQLGKAYYPKAVGVIPATPSTVYSPLCDREDYAELLASAVDFLREELPRLGVMSLSFLFTQAPFADDLESLGFHRWVHQGFEWKGEGLDTFDDYLALFNKNQRKNIRKERKRFQESGLEVRLSSPDQLDQETADDMFDLYERTNDQFGPWAAKFLNREFFREVFRTCADNIVLVNAVDRGEVVARSMLLKDRRRLFGRYWGTRRFVKDMHFNLCYYEPIDYAIRENLVSFDPGMGGEHKPRRGFQAVEQYSMHLYFDPLMDQLFRGNIHQFNESAQGMIEHINSHLPLKDHR